MRGESDVEDGRKWDKGGVGVTGRERGGGEGEGGGEQADRIDSGIGEGLSIRGLLGYSRDNRGHI